MNSWTFLISDINDHLVLLDSLPNSTSLSIRVKEREVSHNFQEVSFAYFKWLCKYMSGLSLCDQNKHYVLGLDLPDSEGPLL